MKIRQSPLFRSFLLTAILVGSGWFSVANAQLKVWSFSDVDSLYAVEKKPVFYFITAPWCTYCHAMKKSTFTDERVTKMLENNFYFVELDGEKDQEIVFRGHAFNFRPTGNGTGLHELARLLGEIDGEVELPTVGVLNTDYEIVFQQAAFMDKKVMRRVLKAAIAAEG